MGWRSADLVALPACGVQDMDFLDLGFTEK